MDRRDLWCLALLAAIATIFFADVIFAGSNFYHRDLFLYHFPMKRIVRDAMLSGEFPFWNRYYSGGQPLAANPAYELFYPPQWLILIGPYAFGFALHIIAHVYAALAGMYLFLRELRLGRPASVFGALSFGMGGLLLGSLPMLPTFFVWALAPMIGWSVVRTLRAPSLSRFAVAGLLAGMQLVIAEPIAVLQVWLLILAGALLLAGVRLATIVLTVIATTALLVAAVQLVPAVDHARDSARSVGLPFQNVRQFAMPPLRPIEIVIPHLYGKLNPLKGTYWGNSAFERGFPYLASLYNGVAVAILAIAGLLLRAPGSATVTVLSLVSYVVAIGDRTPMLRALYSAGVARGIRYPEKFAAMGIVAVTIFAASIADRLIAGDRRTRRAAIAAAALVLAISTIPLAWSMMPGFTQAFARYWQLPPDRFHLAGLARTIWLTGFALAVVMASLVILLPRMEVRRWLFIAFTVVLFDLGFAGNAIVTRMPASYFTPPDVAALLDGDRDTYAILHRGAWTSPGDANYRALLAHLGPWIARNGLQPFTPAAWGFRSALELDYDETALLPTHDLLNGMMKLGNSGFTRWAESFAAIANVRYIVDYRPIGEVVRRHDFQHAPAVRLTRVPNTGAYYFPNEITTGDVIAYMRSPGIRQPIAFVSTPLPQLSSPRSARVLRLAERTNSATIDVDCATAALLVATVTRHKYWRATIDGHEVPLLPVNLAYQGLIVPAGRHTVEMRYHNPVVMWSLTVSLLAVALCLVAIVMTSQRRLRSEQPVSAAIPSHF